MMRIEDRRMRKDTDRDRGGRGQGERGVGLRR
jgi:hypothetical protein